MHGTCFAFFAITPRSVRDSMNLTRLFITVLLLVLSSQSMALFIPDGFRIGTDKVEKSNDVAC